MSFIKHFIKQAAIPLAKLSPAPTASPIPKSLSTAPKPAGMSKAMTTAINTVKSGVGFKF
jgi:hypothetical protein